MKTKVATLRFYEELNDFLPVTKRKISFTYTFINQPSIKDVIESLGVPHIEVDMILVNGVSVDFNYQLQDQDQVAVYPQFESLDIQPITHLRAEPLRNTKFILDSHLGRLTKYLRMCGFDSLYFNQIEDKKLIEISLREKRIILTKDRGLLKNKKVTHGLWIRAQHPRKQFIEVMNRLDLIKKINFLTRCLVCNTEIFLVPKEQIKNKLPKKTIEYYDEFFLCEHCGKVYWKGSHYENMLIILQSLGTEIKE